MAGLTESRGSNSVNDIINRAMPKIFNFDYPLYDESHREELQRKILRHYYTREIGLETVGLWQMFLETRLNEIMPYYNEMYKTADIKYNPLHNTIVTREHTGTIDKDTKATNKVNTHTNDTEDGTAHGETNTNTDSINKYSDTPQSAVDDIDIRENAYLTNATIDHANTNTVSDTTTHANRNGNSTSNGESNATSNTKDNFTETVTGKQGEMSFSKMIEDYRKAIVNIDLDIIKKLSDLFMNVY